MEDITLILAFIVFALAVTGTLRYNKLRQKWAHVMGVGGAYIIFLGVCLLVLMIGSIISQFIGKGVDANIVGDIKEVAVLLIVILLCLGYAGRCMMKCRSVKERIMLPFAACMIGAGFCWRLLGVIVFHIPMSNGESDSSNEFDMNNMPHIIYDEANNRWQFQHSNGKSVVYHNDAGQTVTIYHGQISGSTANTSAGQFHWY